MRGHDEHDDHAGHFTDDDGVAAELDRQLGAFAPVDEPGVGSGDTGGGLIVDVVLQEA
jgi:hypothetical protein